MVSERASQGRAQVHLQVIGCFQPFPFRAQAMAADMSFTPGYQHKLQAMHDERALVVAGLLAAARVFWPKGRASVEKKLRGMAGDDDEVDYTEIFNIAEKEIPTKIDDEDSDADRPTVKKTLGFEQLQLTPPQQPQPQPQPQATMAQSLSVSEELAVQLQKRFDKEQVTDQDYHDDMARAKLLSLQQPKPPVQFDPMQDPTKDAWQKL